MRALTILMLGACLIAWAPPVEAGPRDHRSGSSTGRDHRTSSTSTAQGGVVVGQGKSTSTAQGGVLVGPGKKKPVKCIRSTLGGPCVTASQANQYLNPFHTR